MVREKIDKIKISGKVQEALGVGGIGAIGGRLTSSAISQYNIIYAPEKRQVSRSSWTDVVG